MKTIKKIKRYLSENPGPTMHWDYREKIATGEIADIFARHSPKERLAKLEEHIYESNLDNIYELEMEHIEDAIRHFKNDYVEENGISEDDFDAKEIAMDIREEVMGTFCVEFSIRELLRDDLNIRICMYSNYDCMNSHWFESQGAYSMDSYFGDMVRMLRLNPAAVKEMLTSKGLTTAGTWRNKPTGKPLITLDDLWQELQNTSCGGNLLTFIGTISPDELLSPSFNGKITIPAGNKCGLFSSMYGGGSVMEMTLQRDLSLDLTKKYDRAGYLSFRLVIDDASDEYGIKETYGVTDKFFGNQIQLAA